VPIVQTINVTQEHIDHGERMHCNKCPIALAIGEQMPRAKEIFVEAQEVSCVIDGTRYLGNLGDDASLFVVNFDRQLPRHLAPFSFILTLDPVPVE
jgi:hypothetical protein